MAVQNDATITYLTEGVDIANDLIAKAFTSQWDAFVDYAYEVLSCEYEAKDVRKINKFINKICSMRNELAAELHHTRVPDSRQIPMEWARQTRVVPDMTGGSNGETLLQFVDRHSQAIGFDISQHVGRDVTVTAARNVIDSGR
jgi:hypothetical protein